MKYEGKTVSDRRTDGQTDRQTDGRKDKVRYRGVCYAPKNKFKIMNILNFLRKKIVFSFEDSE